jgi:hypothetical protein
MRSTHNCALKGRKPHSSSNKSGDSGDVKATFVATQLLLTALALSSVFAFVACVACPKNALHGGFDKNRGSEIFYLIPRMGALFLVATQATRYKNNIYLF